jgi:hypothetical protein
MRGGGSGGDGGKKIDSLSLEGGTFMPRPNASFNLAGSSVFPHTQLHAADS